MIIIKLGFVRFLVEGAENREGRNAIISYSSQKH